MSSGPIGYGDWQQLVSWDQGQLAWNISGPQSGAQVSPVIDCHAFGYTYVRQNQQVASSLATMRWYPDTSLAFSIGSRQWVFDSGNTGAAQLELVNLGPYAQLTVDPGASGPAWQGAVNVLLTNRIHPSVTTPAAFTLAQFAPALGAGASVTDVFNAYFAGPVGLHTFGGSQGVTIQPQYMTAGFSWVNIDSYAVAANADDYRVRIWPMSVGRVIITNQSGAAANNTSLFQAHYSNTGSS